MKPWTLPGNSKPNRGLGSSGVVPVVASATGGWAKEIVETDSVLLPAPFRQVEFNRMLRLLLSAPAKIEEMTREAVTASATLDLERRFEFAADVITGVVEK